MSRQVASAWEDQKMQRRSVGRLAVIAKVDAGLPVQIGAFDCL